MTVVYFLLFLLFTCIFVLFLAPGQTSEQTAHELERKVKRGILILYDWYLLNYMIDIYSYIIITTPNTFFINFWIFQLKKLFSKYCINAVSSNENVFDSTTLFARHSSNT